MSVDLFTPIVIGPYERQNRAVMAPLTRSRAQESNVPSKLNALYYAQRASAGLIIAEATQIVPEGQGYISTPGIHSAEQIEAWRMVTRAVHVAGGRIFLQLWHVGRISHSSFQPGGVAPVAPSAIRAEGQAFTKDGFQPHPTPRALSRDEIPSIVEAYATAARNALAADFDGVEIHGANGYLIDQFLRDGTNERTDDYGGSIENRARFLLEIVDAVARVAQPERTGVRISPQVTANDIRDSNPQALFNYVAGELGRRGLVYMHVIEGDTTGKPVAEFDYATLRRAFGGLYIANYHFDKERANAAIAEGRVDMVAFGKPFIANPDLVVRFLLDAPLLEVDPSTMYGGAEEGYTDYPILYTLRQRAGHDHEDASWG
ncbi:MULTISPECIES: alkene reductase [Rhodomicrobium]|uniref:alkene reductase n=1 Tax=Rhodomicrobium TaxID=1068 RepID=UPI000B4C0CDF|nr:MULTISPECIES: alkene reductase [Rhodomicrobium]